ERGVPRETFGMRKTGGSVRFVTGQDPWSPHGHNAFVIWVLTTPILFAQQWRKRLLLAALLTALRSSLLFRPLTPRKFSRVFDEIGSRIGKYLRRNGAEDYAFLWAMTCVCQHYRTVDVSTHFHATDDNRATAPPTTLAQPARDS